MRKMSPTDENLNRKFIIIIDKSICPTHKPHSSSSMILKLQHASKTPGSLLWHNHWTLPSEFLIQYVRGRDLSICILNKFLGEADDACPGPTVQSFIQHILSTHYVEGTNLGVPNRTRQTISPFTVLNFCRKANCKTESRSWSNE